jgi:putative membrane protein
LRKTQEGTGILIYISLHERMVRILGDDSISAKLTQDDWNGVRDTIIEGIRSKRPADGLKEAILKCGELLAQHFPIRPDDANELSNEIHIVD